MDNYTGNQDILVPTYTQELVNMTQASQERMQTLKENNKQMMKTVSKLVITNITNPLATIAQATLITPGASTGVVGASTIVTFEATS
ncbi:hypothetical protein Goshw_001797 [Gossypium schwendimanii]|uniref:Uncharacterized protein n=1 Tax=Gossypium schwendimanii TaxID=34291 RepID=A0A7J9LJV2_GOSSC|nr:hypothetical protein [Gossypium schwendimanii]